MATCARCDSILRDEHHVCLALPHSTTVPEPLAQCGRCGSFGLAGAPCSACPDVAGTRDYLAEAEQASRIEAELGYPAGEPMVIGRRPRPAILARVTGHVRSIYDGRARLYLDEQPAVWEGAETGQAIEVIVVARP